VIGIIDYGMGNLLSVKNAVEYLGFDAELISSPEELASFLELALFPIA
jgi:imidazole glycerol-phosphate synthase subunit HisH